MKNHSRTVVSHVMQLAASPEVVFPLLCPVREYEWIDAWRCEMIYADSGKAEPGAVFQTNFAQDGPTDTWVISRYEPLRAIEFVRINALRTIHYAIHLETAENGMSQWRWTQTLTSLNEPGNALVAGVDGNNFAQKIAALESKLAHFLATGTMLRDNALSPSPENSR